MSKKTGIMIIHGLMGSPKEFEELERALRRHGYPTRPISLPGHGDLLHMPLKDIRAEDLLAHCRQEYEDFAGDLDQVIVVGHSLGGICTLVTAAGRPPKLGGVVALAAPFEHAYSVNRPFDLLTLPANHLISSIRYVPEHYTGFERPMFHPFMFPKLLQQADLMLGQLQREITRIDVPVMLAHSPYDLVIPYSEMEKLASNLPREGRVLTHTFEKCGHQIFPYTRESHNAIARILDFLEQIDAKAA